MISYSFQSSFLMPACSSLESETCCVVLLAVGGDGHLLTAIGQDAAQALFVEDAREGVARVECLPDIRPRPKARLPCCDTGCPSCRLRSCNEARSTKSSTGPCRQIKNVLPLVGFSLVVRPVIAPSSTLQNFGLPSQPSRLVPLKIGLKPDSSSAAAGQGRGRGSAAVRVRWCGAWWFDFGFWIVMRRQRCIWRCWIFDSKSLQCQPLSEIPIGKTKTVESIYDPRLC